MRYLLRHLLQGELILQLLREVTGLGLAALESVSFGVLSSSLICGVT